MNIQRSVLEGSTTPVSGLGRAGGRSWAELLADAGLGRVEGRAPAGPGRRSRVPDGDIVVVGRKGGDDPDPDAGLPESRAPRRPASRVRTTLLLGVAAYYLAWGVYQGIAMQKPRAIYVNPTLNSKIVIT